MEGQLQNPKMHIPHMGQMETCSWLKGMLTSHGNTLELNFELGPSRKTDKQPATLQWTKT